MVYLEILSNTHSPRLYSATTASLCCYAGEMVRSSAKDFERPNRTPIVPTNVSPSSQGRTWEQSISRTPRSSKGTQDVDQAYIPVSPIYAADWLVLLFFLHVTQNQY
jgi:hypothetical protein